MTTDTLHLPTDGEPVEITPRHLKALLVRNWLTHDAMWFAGAVDELGIETANRLNRRAVAGMSAVEAARILRIMGLEEVRTGAELRRFFDVAIALVIPSAIEFTVGWEPDERAVCFEITRCFAFEGVTALGVADTYECGIYERVKGWLDALGVGYEIDPDDLLCSMQHRGVCDRRFTLDLTG
jgi:hypothetical protein